MKKQADIAIIGIGVTRFGELFHQSYDDLVRDAALQAIADAQIAIDDVDAAWLSTAFPEIGVFKGRSGMDICEPLSLFKFLRFGGGCYKKCCICAACRGV
jgi:acetyl-CoA acetyltransferase